MNTFKIETTQTEKREIEIEFPSFYKTNYGAVIGIISESDVYRCFTNDKYTSISSGTVEEMASSVRDTIGAERIHEAEFMSFYNAARFATDLTPTLHD